MDREWLSISKRPPKWKPEVKLVVPLARGDLNYSQKPAFEKIPENQYLNGIVPGEIAIRDTTKEGVLGQLEAMADFLHDMFPNAKVIIGHRGEETPADGVEEIGEGQFVIHASVTAFDGEAVHSGVSPTNYVTIKE